MTLNRVGSILTLFFAPGPIESFADAKRADGARFRAYFHALLRRGVFIAPAPCSSPQVST